VSIAADAASAVSLSLISHTNAGKTTLARTLLGRDVGEVRDAPHITQEATPFTMIETREGDALILWDTPGFGDSARLARRLAQQGNPIGWFLSQVWDRFRDRTFWLSQQAVHNVRDQADIVLYLVNAAEEPEDAGYLGPELDVLGWIGKPVVCLLNQTGPPRPQDAEAADEARWQAVMQDRGFVRAVLSLDAFARCWVQEIELLRTLVPLVPEAKRAGYERLVAAWRERRTEAFERAIEALAAPIAQAAVDSEPIEDGGLRETFAGVAKSLGLGRDEGPGANARASQALAARLDAGIREGTDRLIAIHGLEGHASGEVLARLARTTTVDAPVDERKAAMMGGVVSGALTGLAADLAAGGITFGAGLLTGAVLGALGGAGIARGMNLVRGRGGSALRWDDAFLTSLVAAALLRYLAVAHYGRGRGEWVESEYPAFWHPLVGEIVAARRDELSRVWARRSLPEARETLDAELYGLIKAAAREALERLYPSSLARTLA
jgi:hypothetical protein